MQQMPLSVVVGGVTYTAHFYSSGSVRIHWPGRVIIGARRTAIARLPLEVQLALSVEAHRCIGGVP